MIRDQVVDCCRSTDLRKKLLAESDLRLRKLGLFQELMNCLQRTLRKLLQTTKQASRSRVKSIESLASLRGTNTQDLDLVPMQTNNVGRHVFSHSEDNTRDPANGIANVKHTQENQQNATDVEKETTMDENYYNEYVFNRKCISVPRTYCPCR